MDNIKHTEITCDVVSLKYKDGLQSGYGPGIQGSYALAAKCVGGHEVKSFVGESAEQGVEVKTLREHVNSALSRTLLDEEWKRRRMEEGYDGAARIMSGIQCVFEIQCVSGDFSSGTLDELARQYAADEEMRRFFARYNPFAGEETARRMLELESRGKWEASPDVKTMLQKDYLKLEADLEDGIQGTASIQGGSVEIVADRDVEAWNRRLARTDEAIDRHANAP